MRILIAADVPPDPNAGASGTVFQMNAALQRLGHDVDVIWAPELGRRIRHGNGHYLLELPWAYRNALRRRLKQHQYDVVEFNQPHAYLAADEFRRHRTYGVFVNRSHGHEVRAEEAVAPWRKELCVPVNRGIRSLFSPWIRILLNRQWQRIVKSADGFHVSCEEDADFLQNRYGVLRDRLGVISQGIPDLFIDHPVQTIDRARLNRMLYIGQFAFIKGPNILAKAVSTILAKYPEMTLTWVCGRSAHHEARDLIDPQVHSRVAFLDWMPQELLRSFFDDHGIFLFPSFFEGFGKAPLEAMSRGLCVVASETGGMRDFIRDGVSGRLVPIGRPDLMAAAVESLIENPEGATAMSQAARATAVPHRWDRCAADLTEFYRRLLAKRQEPNAAKVVQ